MKRNLKWPPNGRIRCCSPRSTATAGRVGFLQGYFPQAATRGYRVTKLSATVADRGWGVGCGVKGDVGAGSGEDGEQKSPEAEKHFPKKLTRFWAVLARGWSQQRWRRL